MNQRNAYLVWLFVAVITVCCGYVWWTGGSAENGEADIDPPTPFEPASVPPTAHRPASRAVPTPKVKLQLKLKRGDRFPLLKTIQERVTQFAPDGPIESRTETRLLLAIRVEDVRSNGAIRMRVEYQQVKYSQNIAGEKLDYNSDHPPARVPPAAQAYHAMVGNGFSFWLGPDNRILSVEDWDQFLHKCVRHVPARNRRAVLEKFGESSGKEGIANFVDDSIGLLPLRGPALKVGDHWKRGRRVSSPIPVVLSSNCILKELTDETAVIDIAGTIQPDEKPATVRHASGALEVAVTGGRSMGWCTIERRTGLPRTSRITRDFDMVVRLPTGQTLQQRKSTVTRIEVYSAQGGAKALSNE